MLLWCSAPYCTWPSHAFAYCIITSHKGFSIQNVEVYIDKIIVTVNPIINRVHTYIHTYMIYVTVVDI